MLKLYAGETRLTHMDRAVHLGNSNHDFTSQNNCKDLIDECPHSVNAVGTSYVPDILSYTRDTGMKRETLSSWE